MRDGDESGDDAPLETARHHPVRMTDRSRLSGHQLKREPDRCGRAPPVLQDAIYDLAMLEWLGRAGARRRYVILGVWAAVALAGGVFGAGVFDRTESEEGARGDSARVQERLDELAPDGETVVAVIGGGGFFTPAPVGRAPHVMPGLRAGPRGPEGRDAYPAGGAGARGQ